MPEIINVKAVNIDELIAALNDAPTETARFVKTELFRFARRVRRKLIRERMQGAPGIKGGVLARGGNVKGFQTGSDLPSLKAVTKISRILRTHEEGHTFRPVKAAALFLSKKTGKAGQGKIFARVKSVTLPARLGFEALWRREVPDGTERVHDAMARAMRVAMEKRMKVITSVIEGAAYG